MAKSDKYFLRRDMKQGMVVLVGEDDEKDHPYISVATIRSPRGHMTIMMDQNGKFVVEVHPEGGEALDIVGRVDLFLAVVETVGGIQMDDTKDNRSKMN